MGLVEWVKQLVQRPVLSEVESDYFGAVVTPQDKAQRVYTYNATNAELIARATGYVHICASLKATYAAGVPLRLMKRGSSPKGRKVTGRKAIALRNPILGKASIHAENAGDVTEILDSPLLALLANPNFTDTGVEFMRLTYYFESIDGNAYWQHDGEENKPPTNLFTLYPQWTNPQIGDEGIYGYRFGRNFSGQIEIPASNVIHHRHLLSPQNPWMGVGDLNAVTTEGDIYTSAIVWEKSYWDNDARPAGVMKVPPGTTDDQIKALYERIEKYRGPRKAGRVQIGTDIDWTMAQFSQREMQYVEGFDRVRRTICNAFGIPIQMIEMNDSGITLGGGGAQFAARTQFLSQTIMPMVVGKAERLTESLLPCFGYEPGEYWLVPDNAVPEDRKSMEDGTRADVLAGILESNEARAERGLEPLPDGNGLRVNGQRVDLLDKVTSQPKVDPNKPKPSDSVKTLEVVARCKKVTTYFRHSLAGNGKRHKKDAKDQDPYLDLSGQETALAAQMADFYNSVNWTVEDGKVTLDQKKERERLEVILLLFLTRVTSEGYATGKAEILVSAPGSGAVFPTESALEAWVKEEAARAAKSIVQNISDTLRGAAEQAVQEGLSPQEVKEAVQKAMDDLKEIGPERIASTETVRGVMKGRITAAEDSQVVEMIRWVTSEDELVCPLCQSMNKKEMEPGGVWFKKGDILDIDGVKLVLDYDNVEGPPIHVDCRCWIEYVYYTEIGGAT